MILLQAKYWKEEDDEVECSSTRKKWQTVVDWSKVSVIVFTLESCRLATALKPLFG